MAELRAVIKNFGTHAELAVTLPLRGLVRFDGPSGAGKTTLLNAIAWALGYGPANPRGTLGGQDGGGGTTSVRLVCDAGWSVERRCRPSAWTATGSVGGASGHASGAEAVAAWLERAFGPAVGAPELFPVAAYLRQGERAALGQQPTQMFRTLCDHACAPIRAGAVCRTLQMQSKEADGAASEAIRGFAANFPGVDPNAEPGDPRKPGPENGEGKGEEEGEGEGEGEEGADGDEEKDAARLAEAHERLGAARAVERARARADQLATEAGLTTPTSREAIAAAAHALRTAELCADAAGQSAVLRGLGRGRGRDGGGGGGGGAQTPEAAVAALRQRASADPLALIDELVPLPDSGICANPTEVAAVERVGVESVAAAVTARMSAPLRALSTDAVRAALELALRSATPQVVRAARQRLAEAGATMPDWDQLVAETQRAQAASLAATADLARLLSVPLPEAQGDPPLPDQVPGIAEAMARDDAAQRCGALCDALQARTVLEARGRVDAAAAAAIAAASARKPEPPPPLWRCGECAMCGAAQLLAPGDGQLVPPHGAPHGAGFGGEWKQWAALAAASVPERPPEPGERAGDPLQETALLWSPLVDPATGPAEAAAARVRLNTARSLLAKAKAACGHTAAAWRALLVQADRRAPPTEACEADGAAPGSVVGDAVRALCARAGEAVVIRNCSTAALVNGIRVCRAQDGERARRWLREAVARIQEDTATFGPQPQQPQQPQPQPRWSRPKLALASSAFAAVESGLSEPRESADAVAVATRRVERITRRIALREERARAARVREALARREAAIVSQSAARVALRAAQEAGREVADLVLGELSQAANAALAELFPDAAASVALRSVPRQNEDGSALDIQVALGPCSGTLDHAGLSGGERARFDLALQLAVAEVVGPPVFFVDEGLSGLDSATGLRALSVLRRMASRMLVVVVSHQLDDPGGALFDRVLPVTPPQCAFAQSAASGGDQPPAKRARKRTGTGCVPAVRAGRPPPG